MLKLYFIISVFTSLLTSEVLVDTINKIPTRQEVLKLTEDASSLLDQSNFERSFIASKLALHYALIRKDNLLIARAYNIIGSNYGKLSEYDKAIYNYNKGLLYAQKGNNDTIKNCIYNNLGNIYCFEKKDYKKGLLFLKKTLLFDEKNKDTAKIVLTKLNITWAYFDNASYKEGIEYLDFINKNSTKYGNESDAIIVNMLNGMYAGFINKDIEAEAFFFKAIQLGEHSEQNEDLSFVFLEYSKYLFKKGDYKNAYIYLVSYNKLTKQINNSENIKRAKRVGIDIELEGYKRKVDSITAVNTLQEQGIKKTKIIVGLFIIVIIILLLQMYTLYKNYLFKKKSIQDLTRSNADLIVAKEMADESSRLKTQFVSTITHELRTPLYGVVGITNMLLEEHKELENSPHLNSLKFSAKYLLTLINDVLQINKIEENRIVLQSLTFNISDEIKMIINSLSFIAKDHNNTIEIDLDPNIPDLLIGDKLRFSQILINLLSNALKFTNHGKVFIIVKLISVEGNTNLIEFNIKDTGIGIAREDHSKIFDKFTQVGRKELDYQGTGLGLPIVQKLLELFKSTIHLHSEVGHGSTFSFVIGFDTDLHSIGTMNNYNELETSESQLFSVLVVDDNTINRMVTKKIIENNNNTCTVVESGYDAIELLKINEFDVILMDINMPVMNGFEATRFIRKMGITIPIIALTAFSKEEVAEESKSSGMNDIIVKPFESTVLFKTISRLILNN
ncbi:response regulator [Flavobacterium sp. 7A]|uniref:response regulator n=1 Tax=Flavobacterium sp. 7A TaxID=2940571 RepID=UPI002226A17F|nr:response regulator [Flavobacterium sp. 7A]MCW2119969.1 signal transduction histidine kinase [Flavobacterium sp. 7A]